MYMYKQEERQVQRYESIFSRLNRGFWNLLSSPRQESEPSSTAYEYKQVQAYKSAGIYQLNHAQYEEIHEQVLKLYVACAAASPGGGPPSKEDRAKIIAAILSALMVGGGVCLIVMTGGAATPGLLLAQSMLINAGTSGLTYCRRDDFSSSDWAKTVANSGVVTLLTFGASHMAGTYVGLALQNSDISTWKILALGSIAGAVTGSSVRAGCYIVACYVNGEEVDRFELMTEASQGAAEGAYAGFLGATAKTLPRKQISQKPKKPNRPSGQNSSGVTELDPASIRYSQDSVNFSSKNRNFDEMVSSMDAVGFLKGSPIDVVKMPDGRYTSMDNRRLFAANLTGTKVIVRIHDYNEMGQFGSGGKTWGDAIKERIASQRSLQFKLENNGQGSYRNPYVCGASSGSNMDKLLNVINGLSSIINGLIIFEELAK